MERDKSGFKTDDDNDVIIIDDYPTGHEYYEFSNNKYQSGSRGGERHAKNIATGFRDFQPSQGPPHYFWRRGNVSTGPPLQQGPHIEHKNVAFLIRCGVLVGALKGLPKVLLDLMEERYCGVCALGFDHLDTARSHYTSKNHSKNQKKWLDQQTKVGSLRPREIPIKSRAQYCELCDIDITSKTHGESHYAGRSHRAIVAGLRLPKNPFLLQDNMQARVKQLIRREQRCLKSVIKPASEMAKKTKPNPPELYCDICKTSVTTMDQMTMHLNGQKHLKKEKSHIFKMMEHGSIESTPATPAGPAEPAGTDKDADGQGVNENDFDWGEGGGTWDDDPQ